jgi:hypothetical protein
MPIARQGQLNVRSEFARTRARELAKLTGMTTTQVVEDALRGYIPPGGYDEGASSLIRAGRVLVIPANGGSLSLDQANAALETVRNGEDDD